VTNIIDLYNTHIYNRFNDLLISGKSINDFDNYDLSKIFEYYVCIHLTNKYKQNFYEYSDINPTFKEINKMSKNDTGIDCCNLIDNTSYITINSYKIS
jgi:hypothetical protein